MKNLKLVETASEAVENEYTTVYGVKGDGSVVIKGGKTEPTFEYVDLGLPSGLKWAKCNIGATSETEYGKYFQWGDTVGYEDASHSTWTTAPFNNGSSNYDESYFTSVSGTVCPNGVLAKEYDAASVNMGGSWRMPTKEDFEELTANTNSSWEENFNGSGVNGFLFRSTKDMDKYIFIPSAGFASNGSFNYQGSIGAVWSSSLNSSYLDNAWNLNFNSGGMNVYDDNRRDGYSVRGVCK